MVPTPLRPGGSNDVSRYDGEMVDLALKLPAGAFEWRFCRYIAIAWTRQVVIERDEAEGLVMIPFAAFERLRGLNDTPTLEG